MAYYSFSEEAVNHAIEAANRAHSGGLKASAGTNAPQHGHILVAAECVSVTVEDHKVCVNLPLGFGKHCLTLPVNIPNGTAGQACLSICTHFGIPTGVKVSVKIAGVTVYEQTFGAC